MLISFLMILSVFVVIGTVAAADSNSSSTDVISQNDIPFITVNVELLPSNYFFLLKYHLLTITAKTTKNTNLKIEKTSKLKTIFI